MKDLKALIRPNIQTLCRQFMEPNDIVFGKHTTLLNACESPFNAPFNRHPLLSEMQGLKRGFANYKQIMSDMVTLSVGQSTALDLILRVFCTPQRDNIIIHEPSPSIYAKVAALNDVECRHCRMNAHFDITADHLLSSINQRSKVIVLCSPNYPTGNSLNRKEIIALAERFDGLVVIDETYVEFSRNESFSKLISRLPNIVVIGNFSAAFALASLQLNYVISSPEIAHYLDFLTSYKEMPQPVSQTAIEMFTRRRFDVDKWVKWILDERSKVMAAVKILPLCKEIYPSASNFFMMRVDNAAHLKKYLSEQQVEVTDCSHYMSCDNCLNITIGLTPQNNALLGALRKY